MYVYRVHDFSSNICVFWCPYMLSVFKCFVLCKTNQHDNAFVYLLRRSFVFYVALIFFSFFTPPPLPTRLPHPIFNIFVPKSLLTFLLFNAIENKSYLFLILLRVYHIAQIPTTFCTPTYFGTLESLRTPTQYSPRLELDAHDAVHLW